jgi:hypothetical protein
MFQINQRVSTEFGAGVVSESSTRRVVIDLDSGDRINVATGTPGYGRITAECNQHRILGYAFVGGQQVCRGCGQSH